MPPVTACQRMAAVGPGVLRTRGVTLRNAPGMAWQGGDELAVDTLAGRTVVRMDLDPAEQERLVRKQGYNTLRRLQ